MVIAPVDTPVSDFPDIPAGAEAAALAINANGGIAGRPVEVKFCNDQTDPNKATACAREAVTDRVAAVVPYSLFTAQIFPILERAGIPAVGTQIVTPPDTESPISYPLVAGSLLMNSALPVQLRAHGKRKIAGFALDVAASRNQLRVIERGIRNEGLEYAGGITIPVNATDYAPFVQKLRDLGADAAIMSLSQQATVQLLRAGRQAGLDVTWAHQAQLVNPSNVLEPLGSVSDGLLVATSLPPASDTSKPGIEQFNAEMDAAAEAGVEPTDDRRWSTIDSWLSVHAIDVLGEELGDRLDSTTLKAALDSASDVDLLGLVNWSPSVPGPPEYPRLSNGEVMFTVAEDGELVPDGDVEPVDVFDVLGLG